MRRQFYVYIYIYIYIYIYCHGVNESTDSEMLEGPQRVIY